MSLEEITAAIAALSEAERQRLYVELERRDRDLAAPEQERSPSAHDRAKALIGPGSGLGNLSTDPAHMKGFGEGGR